MKSWPDPYFRKWKIKVQKIKPSVSGVCWKSKNNGTRDENSSAQHVTKRNLNSKTSTCAGNVQSQPFLPTQFPLPHRINALLASQMPKLSTLAYQKKWGNSSPCYTTHLYQPILNQSPKGTPLNFTPLGLRLSSHTSLFWTLPEQLSILHHAARQPILNQRSKDKQQNLRP